MANYEFSERSKHLLSTVDERLQEVFNEAIKRTPVDFGISSGYRSPVEQLKLFTQGRLDDQEKVTNLDGYNKLSKHNQKLAVDIYAYRDGRAWFGAEDIKPIAEVVKEIAAEKGIDIRWGWDLWEWDAPHFELA